MSGCRLVSAEEEGLSFNILFLLLLPTLPHPRASLPEDQCQSLSNPPPRWVPHERPSENKEQCWPGIDLQICMFSKSHISRANMLRLLDRDGRPGCFWNQSSEGGRKRASPWPPESQVATPPLLTSWKVRGGRISIATCPCGSSLELGTRQG